MSGQLTIEYLVPDTFLQDWEKGRRCGERAKEEKKIILKQAAESGGMGIFDTGSHPDCSYEFRADDTCIYFVFPDWCGL